MNPEDKPIETTFLFQNFLRCPVTNLSNLGSIRSKPAGELYADVLLAADRPAEAVTAYRQSLDWIPQRTPSMRGLAEAAARVGDAETAAEMTDRLKSMPGISSSD